MFKVQSNNSQAAKQYLKTLLPSFCAIIALFIVGNLIANGFISMNNISSIFMTAALLAIASIAQNTVVIAGNNGIDLSIGAVASCTALICPSLPMENPWQLLLAVLLALAIGALFGSINGLFISVTKIAPLIVTLIMASVVSGVVMVLTRGQPSAWISDLLRSISNTVLPPFRVLTIIGIVIVAVSEWILKKTRAGRKLQLIGDNNNAAGIAGINTRKGIFYSYVVSGSLAGLLGLLIVGYAGSTTLNMAESYTLLSLAAITIGGTNLSGGQGSFVSGALGAIVLIQLTSILQALNMDQGRRQVIQGGLLLVIMIVNTRSQLQKSR
jgi:ribose transport system permease protein